jgi:FtsH-binding integral membrane protein
MGLMGVLIASLVNMFMKSSGVYFATSVLGTLIFIGLTAYSTQKVKHMYYSYGPGFAASNLGVLAALDLYMNFINIFLHLLQFFGDRRGN